jgi:hypothetical protein
MALKLCLGTRDERTLNSKSFALLGCGIYPHLLSLVRDLSPPSFVGAGFIPTFFRWCGIYPHLLLFTLLESNYPFCKIAEGGCFNIEYVPKIPANPIPNPPPNMPIIHIQLLKW